MSSECYAITGGSGYIGFRLAHHLLNSNGSNSVLLLDIRPPPDHSDTDRIIYRHCDLQSKPSVHAALSGATCVFHLASYGMSGREMLNTTMIYDVNVTGTENVLNECLIYQIKKIIYCSTYNAVFTGNEALLGVSEDECLYPSPDAYCDNYSRTKSLAEQTILRATSSELHTAVIRPAAIYGDGEARHLPRILNLVRQGLAFFCIGHEGILCDWVYADNLVHALILASKSLPQHSGQVYFISDDKPVNNFEFLAQLTRGLGYRYCFAFYIPTSIMFYLAYAVEITHKLFATHVYNFAPFLTRAEVLKVGVTHYANIHKAKQLLNYKVKVSPEEAMQRCIKWYSEQGYNNASTSRSSIKYGLMILACLVVIILLFLYYY